MRASYDLCLASPKKSKYVHMYNYYNAKYSPAPKHDPIRVSIIIILALSTLQYII